MSDDLEEGNNLLDEDPALDFILYQDMNQKDKRPEKKIGCLTVALIFILPIGSLFFRFFGS